MQLKKLLEKKNLSKNDIIRLLSVKNKQEIEMIRKKAYFVMKQHCGEKVYYRGLLEFSNLCANNCYYCGIRKGNKEIMRYSLEKEEITNIAAWCADNGYGSIVLQSGERRDSKFVDFVEDVTKKIKEKTKSDRLPNGLGVTLSVGEQDYAAYRRFFEAGAHRYLLRIETTNPELFKKTHPKNQTLKNRKKCLRILKKIGYQIGSGVMIGLPGQTIEDLADDIMFFKKYDIDMIGMGPYITHRQTPMKRYGQETKNRKEDVFNLSLMMIAVTRIALKDVNIATTTALQALYPDGREKGLQYGANVIMPLVTPKRVRKEYMLYDGKPCIDEDTDECKLCLLGRIKTIGRSVGFDEWGDPKHFLNRTKK